MSAGRVADQGHVGWRRANSIADSYRGMQRRFVHYITARRALSHEGSVILPLAHITKKLPALLCGLVFASFLALAGIHTPRAQEPPEIVFLGDSLTAGLGVERQDGFPERLSGMLAEEGLPIHLVNAGSSGDTSAGGLSRLDWSVPDTVDGVVVALGANDALRGIPVERTRENLATIIARLKERGVRVLLAGMLSPPNMGGDYEQAFNRIYPELAEEFGINFVPFLLDGVAGQKTLNQEDGMHPNAQGMAVIARSMLPQMKEFVRQIMEDG